MQVMTETKPLFTFIENDLILRRTGVMVSVLDSGLSLSKILYPSTAK